MSLWTNVTGLSPVTREIKELWTNVTGLSPVIREIKEVWANDGIIPRMIYGSWTAPSTITWSMTTNATGSISSLNPSNNGYSCEFITHDLHLNGTILGSIIASMSITGNTKVGFTYKEAYWNTPGSSGLDTQYWVSIDAKNNATGNTITILSGGAPGPDKTKTQYGILPTGNYDISMSIFVRGTGTQYGNLEISVEKAS